MFPLHKYYTLVLKDCLHHALFQRNSPSVNRPNEVLNLIFSPGRYPAGVNLGMDAAKINQDLGELVIHAAKTIWLQPSWKPCFIHFFWSKPKLVRNILIYHKEGSRHPNIIAGGVNGRAM